MVEKIFQILAYFLGFLLPAYRGESEAYKLQRLAEVGRRYREGTLHKKALKPRLKKELLRKGQEWKLRQPHFQGNEFETLLTKEEKIILDEAATFAPFSEIILGSKSLSNHFFTWILRDENPLEIFIKFPEKTLELIKNNLSSRIGRLGADVLKIQPTTIPALTLKMEGRDINIMDPHSLVTFKNDYVLTVSEIFSIFQNKNIEAGNLEFMQEGIINWSPIHLGPWNPLQQDWDRIKVEKKGWIEELPVLFSLNPAGIKERYGLSLAKGEWVVSAGATRGQRNLDFEGTHAFLEVAIPQKDDKYFVYDFGKVAKEFPKNLAETVAMLCLNSRASVSYPDENVFFTHRQEGFTPFVITETEGKYLLSLIKEDILRSRKGNIVYQIESENCAKWVHTQLVKTIGAHSVPSLFWMPLLDAKSKTVLGFIFHAISLLPHKLQMPFMVIGHNIMGAFKETVIEENGMLVGKSLSKHEFLQHGNVYLPALMLHQIENSNLAAEYKRLRNYLGVITDAFLNQGVNKTLLPFMQCRRLYAIRGLCLIYATPFANLQKDSLRGISLS